MKEFKKQLWNFVRFLPRFIFWMLLALLTFVALFALMFGAFYLASHSQNWLLFFKIVAGSIFGVVGLGILWEGAQWYYRPEKQKDPNEPTS